MSKPNPPSQPPTDNINFKSKGKKGKGKDKKDIIPKKTYLTRSKTKIQPTSQSQIEPFKDEIVIETKIKTKIDSDSDVDSDFDDSSEIIDLDI